jgi:hypothetical protein
VAAGLWPSPVRGGLIEAPDQAAQVEIDALAALRPEELTRIAEAALAPYLDPGLQRRFVRAHTDWTEAAAAAVAAQVDEDTVVDIRDRAAVAVERYNDALDNLRSPKEDLDDLQDELDDAVADIEAPEPPEAPDAEIDEAAHHPLIDLDWDFVTATQALRARKAYAGEAESQT